MKQRLVSEDQLQRILDHLRRQPYEEAQPLIQMILALPAAPAPEAPKPPAVPPPA